MKIKKIVLSGFRGVLTKQELNLTQNGNPTSLAIYGLNSSGKTSFVDGIEWFLSPSDEIEWLKRDNAGPHAYPHQASNDGDTYAEIEFSDTSFGLMKKAFNQKRVTIPTLSSGQKFRDLYDSFTIRPYLRYLEIIDFVFNRTGVEKYKKLAEWVGFEDELAFQEKIALGIIPHLRTKEKSLAEQQRWIEDELKRLVGTDIDDATLISFSNELLKKIGQPEIKSLDELKKAVKKITDSQPTTTPSKIEAITKFQTFLQTLSFSSDLIPTYKKIEDQTTEFNQKKEIADKIDYISLYEKAFEILEKDPSTDTACPVCGNPWKKEDLVKHIKKELSLLQELKQKQEELALNVTNLKAFIAKEKETINSLRTQIQISKDAGIVIEAKALDLYKESLKVLEKSFEKSIFEAELKADLLKEQQSEAELESKKFDKDLEKEKGDMKLSDTVVNTNEIQQKLIALSSKVDQLEETKKTSEFYSTEISKFVELSEEVFRLIQENITKRFQEISSIIEKYFGILRQDKDIKNIEVTLNLEQSKAVGRSAEIQLSYYNLTVKPAYKVLSESLLNSLGLAVYFTCIKKFNLKSKFVILDDIMNSLDTGHRDTLLDLLDQEFSDYQIILFTHDLLWFEKIQKMFPNWQHKKIKSWDYATGPKIGKSNSAMTDIQELLEDSTKAKEAGRELGIYVEDSLNELCELLCAEMRYRYTRNDPPALEELFNSLCKRLKDKLGKNPVVAIAQNAQKYEPIMRNASSHSRSNYASSISPDEVKRALEEWAKLEKVLFCNDCHKYVEYKSDRDQIECRCGKIKLDKVS